MQRKVRERYQNLFREKKKKRNNIVVNVIKISQKIKSKKLAEYRENIIE